MNARSRPRAAEFVEKRRYRAVVEAAVVLHAANFPVSEALQLVCGRRDPRIWNLREWSTTRRALCIALMERNWTVESVCAAMHTDPRTVKKWLVGTDGQGAARQE